MRGFISLVTLFLVATGAPRPACAAVTIYTDEGTFLADLAQLGASVVTESFEDDAAWGDARSTITGGFHTAPSISNLGVTWMPNTGVCGVTTGHGPARTGEWGFYEYPHGDPTNGVHDGFVMVGDGPLHGAGGWFETNTFGTRIRFIVDGVPTVDDMPLDYAHGFLGVIVDELFTTLEVEETETDDEVYYVFADDFTFGFVSPTAVEETSWPALMHRASPNPFAATTTIAFRLDAAAHVTLRIYDAGGRLVRSLLADDVRSGGRHRVAWDGRDGAARTVRAGVYWYRLETGDFPRIGRLTRLE